ncbi:type II secretion system F family protein [Alienimonas sp. DA493]|uniref:type II secretion system F family protein n=1 Tax=Alienimonas sp. DA493 TaxID=3373605 RepID=UPI0037546B43
MFARRLPLAALARLCRSLATLLDSGVTLLKALSVAGGKAGDPRASRLLGEAAKEIENGRELHEALLVTRGFPRLFVELVRVAEGTGHLPEVLRALAEHYENLLRMKKAFLSQIAWPVFQLVAAVLVIGLLIWVLGMIGDGGFDVLGLGLTGTRGAIIWFGGAGAVALAGFALFQLGRHSMKWRRLFDPLLLAIPVVGTCLRNFALARFSWAFALTQNAGMDLRHALAASFSATENGAFAAAAEPVWAEVRAGSELSPALRSTNLFPRDYLEMIEVAEASGSIPEMLERIGPDLEADARRSLSALSAAVGWGVWALVAGVIIWMIFSVFSQYVGMVNEFSDPNFRP